MVNYSCKKLPPATYPLARVHPLWTDEQRDRRTDRRQTTTVPTARPILKDRPVKMAITAFIGQHCQTCAHTTHVNN